MIYYKSIALSADREKFAPGPVMTYLAIVFLNLILLVLFMEVEGNDDKLHCPRQAE